MPLMMGFALICAAMLASAPALAADANPAALAMVRNLQLGENLTGMSYRFATTTPAYENIVRAAGAEKARALVKDEIVKVRPKYQDRWDRNLAASYAELFPPNELQSVAEMGMASPFASAVFAKRNEVGRNMQVKSKDLLNSLIAEALKNAIAQLVPKK